MCYKMPVNKHLILNIQTLCMIIAVECINNQVSRQITVVGQMVINIRCVFLYNTCFKVINLFQTPSLTV